jgi:sugar lactone lactonase YvrE
MAKTLWIVLVVLVALAMPLSAWGASPVLYVTDANVGAITAVAANGARTIIATGLNQPHGLVQRSDGVFFVSTWGSGNAGSGAVSSVSNGVVNPIATGLDWPYSMTMDTANNIYVSEIDVRDNQWGKVLKIAPDGTMSNFATHVGNGAGDLAFDANGNLFVCSYSGGTISKILPDGTVVSPFFATGLSEPDGMAFDAAGNLYVSNFNIGTVSKVDSNGVVSLYASGFSGPAGLGFDSEGNLYVSNYSNSTITKVTPMLVKSTFAYNLGGPSDIVMAVPEPVSLGFLSLGAGALLLRRRRRA